MCSLLFSVQNRQRPNEHTHENEEKTTKFTKKIFLLRFMLHLQHVSAIVFVQKNGKFHKSKGFEREANKKKTCENGWIDFSLTLHWLFLFQSQKSRIFCCLFYRNRISWYCAVQTFHLVIEMRKIHRICWCKYIDKIHCRHHKIEQNKFYMIRMSKNKENVVLNNLLVLFMCASGFFCAKFHFR